MKHFFRGGRELPFGQGYGCSIMQNRDRLLHFVRKDETGRNDEMWRSDVLLVIFCVLFSCLLVSPALGQEAIRLNKIQQFKDSLSVVSQRPYNFGLYEGLTIKPVLSEKRLAAERRRYPKVDFSKFTMQSYKVDDSKIPKLLIGDKLPDSVLDMPLRVVNDAYGRDTITLRSCMDREWIILDIWTEWCVPCIGSMNKWESLAKKEGLDFTLLGVYASYDAHRAMPEARKKGYESTQIIGPGTLLLTHLFFHGKGTLGPTVWIKDGHFFGISQAETLNDKDYHLLLSGRLSAIPEYARWKPMGTQN